MPTEAPTRSADFYIGEGATYPSLEATLTKDNTADDLTGATVTFSMRNSYGTLVTDAASVTVSDATAGKVEYAFSLNDTANTGRHYGHFTATWPGGVIGRFPSSPDKFVVIEIQEKID